MKKLILLFLTFPFVLIAQNEEINKYKILKTFDAINKLYVDSVNSDKITEEAINGMLHQLDPHSYYIPAKRAKEQNEVLRANFKGIGVRYYMINDTLTISNVIDKGPSQKAGIKSGDKIIQINDINVAGDNLNSDDYRNLLLGQKGSKVKLTIKRPLLKDYIFLNVTRSTIPIKSIVSSYMINDSVGYIKLETFNATSNSEFEEHLKKLKKQGLKHLVFDLKNNGGGYLSQAVKISDQFLSEDKMIVYTHGDKTKDEEFFTSKKGNFQNGRLIILINENSASASEIVTGAVQDWDRGIIVGRRSFGKGLVQRQISLEDGAILRLTIARYYTPSGRSIQKPYKGIENYEDEKYNRYSQGELFHKDSIKITDTTMYLSKIKNRPLYGSGGIIPDVFNPLDTLLYTPLYKNVVGNGLIGRFILDAYKIKKSFKVSAKTFDEFNHSFILDDEISQALKNYCVNNHSIIWNNDEFEYSKLWFESRIKAEIADLYFGESYFYEVINQDNSDIVKSLQIITENKI